jgi:hypothetical protein
MGQISSEPRLSEARIVAAIRMIIGRITDSASPSIETSEFGVVSPTGERYRIGAS